MAANVPNYTEQGGARTVIGGELDVVSGGALKVAGTDVTATLAAALSGTAAGFKVARGETALDGSNPTPVATGLTTIVAAVVALKGSSAPGDNTSVITYDTSGGTLNLYAWKNTGGTDPTLVASTGTEAVGWIAIGT
jgi:hypothetical protein